LRILDCLRSEIVNLDSRAGSRVGSHPSFLSGITNGGGSMGSVRDSAPDPNRASGSARQPWPPRVRLLPTSNIVPVTPPRPIYWNRALTSGRCRSSSATRTSRRS